MISAKSQFDERLAEIKNFPEDAIDESLITKWKDEALDKFLSSLDDADVLSATVSQIFTPHDLLGFKALMFSHDIPKLLKTAQERNWPHSQKWAPQCPICNAKEEVNQLRKMNEALFNPTEKTGESNLI